MANPHIHQICAKLSYCYPQNFNCEDGLVHSGSMDAITGLTRLTKKALLTNSIQGLDIIAEHLAAHSNNIYISEGACLSQIDELFAFHHSHPSIIQTAIYRRILENVWLPTFNMNTMLKKMPSMNTLIAPYSRLFVLLVLSNGYYSRNIYPRELLTMLAKLIGTYFYYCRCHSGVQAEHHLFILQALTASHLYRPENADYEAHLQFVMSI